MSSLPPPVPPAPTPPVPPVPAQRSGAGGAVFTILATLGGAAMFAFAWLLAKWIVNTCPEQRVTAQPGDFTTARGILVVATVIWAAVPLLGARYAKRRDLPHLWFLFVAGLIVLVGLVATVTLSSGELCLS